VDSPIALCYSTFILTSKNNTEYIVWAKPENHQ